ncbi:hypothetical protein DPMN_140758 [Dreissena polymorpha]|uniref:Uncharacterized protein n=1 Tax=Dreissena polymorpha TaxID=45954 RepID=A0A9D4JJA6_DREPO|nr:hypothetical protein DPMN_140758 [Dreissena polymorpha]
MYYKRRRGTKKFHRIWILRFRVRGTECRGEKHPRYLFRKRLSRRTKESVLVKEACSVIMHEATGCSYKDATEALQRTRIDVKPGEHKDANILQKSSTWLTTPYGRKMCKDKSGIVALQTPVYC